MNLVSLAPGMIASGALIAIGVCVKWRPRPSPRPGRIVTALLLLALFLMPQPEPVQGTAAFSYRIESAAQVRGMELVGWGSAVLDCDRLGDTAWVFVQGEWYETTVVDCTAAHHRELWAEWGRAVDLPWDLWEAEGWPLMPIPALVVWTAPMEGWE